MFKRILQLLLGVKKKPAYALVPVRNREVPQRQSSQKKS